MERTSNSAGLRPGPLTRRVLARRRRWLRWAAIGLAALTILYAAAQLLYRPAPRRSGPPAPGTRGQPSAQRFYGVAELVPPGMRAVNLIVPAAATFEGRLAPLSRVDVVAAFDLGQDRSVRRVLASGIVLHVTPQPATSGAGLTSITSPAAERFGAAPLAELALAVPAATERELVMALAFGRVFVAVEPASAGASRAGAGPRPYDQIAAQPDDTLSLRRYLGLPADASRVPALSFGGTAPLIPTLAGAPPAPALPWPAPSGPRQAGAVRGAAADASSVTVEIIEGTTRTFAEVHR